MPKLIEIDLIKEHAHTKGALNTIENYADHPDIRPGRTQYLVKYRGKYFAGTFSKVWFGLSFDGWYAPLQYDKPGTNSSNWEAVWEIVDE